MASQMKNYTGGLAIPQFARRGRRGDRRDGLGHVRMWPGNDPREALTWLQRGRRSVGGLRVGAEVRRSGYSQGRKA